MDLFERAFQAESNVPLAARMCPEKLEEFAGQGHIVGEGKLLRRAIESDRISSVIFYGPPGVGKTALAMVISQKTGGEFHRKNAVSSNVSDIRSVIEAAKRQRALHGKKTVLLLDEIHRFNKAQQDVLLPALETGQLILIGTTTENPFFSVNSALLSRSQIFEFKKLEEKEIISLLEKALRDKKRGLGNIDVCFDDGALAHIAKMADGDVRRALGALEIAVLTTGPEGDGTVRITVPVAEDSIQKKNIVYDKGGDAHYDAASAYIKSMRGSDPDAAIYWMAKMIEAGEDPRFIARRLVICASEDVGNADPQALVLATAAMQASDFIGFPEARIILSQATIYVACAPKSNSAYTAIERATEDMRTERTQEVPDHLKEGGYKGASELGRGDGYKYPHSYSGHYVRQGYTLNKKRYYIPGDLGYEKEIKKRMGRIRTSSKDESGE
jgi:putative ATPase